MTANPSAEQTYAESGSVEPTISCESISREYARGQGRFREDEIPTVTALDNISLEITAVSLSALQDRLEAGSRPCCTSLQHLTPQQPVKY
jgi:hypothetical protein